MIGRQQTGKATPIADNHCTSDGGSFKRHPRCCEDDIVVDQFALDLVALALLALGYTVQKFGSEPRSRALVGEETAGAKWLLARARGLLTRDTIVAAYGQGAGFTRAAAIFRVH